ncbi:MAG TPA: DinB family protein, partial [Ktedonobacterales bacterium]|nr:DinB family protein [Ktedonobacterales bacterium]
FFQVGRIGTHKRIPRKIHACFRFSQVALAGVSDAQLAQPVPHSPFGDHSLGALFLTIAQHAAQHLGWLDAARAGQRPPQQP